jgi:flagellar motor switch protein FliN/FliY
MAKRKSAKIPAKKADDNPTAKATPPRDNIEQLESLPLVLTAELGRTSETIETVRTWGDQSLVELDKSVGEPVDVLLNGHLSRNQHQGHEHQDTGAPVPPVLTPVSRTAH